MGNTLVSFNANLTFHNTPQAQKSKGLASGDYGDHCVVEMKWKIFIFNYLLLEWYAIKIFACLGLQFSFQNIFMKTKGGQENPIISN